MADNKINNGEAPVFVHAERVTKDYGGPADPVALWSIARRKVGVEGLCNEQQMNAVRAAYGELCRILPGVELSSPTVKTEEAILGELGKAALS